MGYAGSRSAHILVGQSNENLNVPSACPASECRSVTLSAAVLELFRTQSFSRSWPLTIASGRSVRFSSRPRLKPRVRGTDCMRCLATPSPALSILACLTVWVPTPARSITRCPGTAKLDWGLSQLNLNRQSLRPAFFMTFHSARASNSAATGMVRPTLLWGTGRWILSREPLRIPTLCGR